MFRAVKVVKLENVSISILPSRPPSASRHNSAPHCTGRCRAGPVYRGSWAHRAILHMTYDMIYHGHRYMGKLDILLHLHPNKAGCVDSECCCPHVLVSRARLWRHSAWGRGAGGLHSAVGSQTPRGEEGRWARWSTLYTTPIDRDRDGWS